MTCTLHGFETTTQRALVVLVSYIAPLVALAMARDRARGGAGLLLVGLSGSLAFGAASENLLQHAEGGMGTLLAISATALALIDAVGILYLAAALLPTSAIASDAVGGSVLMVDGVCIFCNRLVSFILERDKDQLFRVGHVQGDYAQRALARLGRDGRDIDPIYLLANAGTAHERLLVDGEVGKEIWPRILLVAMPVRLLPAALLHPGYRLFARVRYALFGKYDTCLVPSAAERARWVDAATG